MAFNFCHPQLQSQVISDKVTTDGYEASNLVSPDVSLQNKGFITESFIKPPINVIFRLPCPIELQSIVLDGKVATQATSALEIYTNTCPVKNKSLWNSESGESKRKLSRYENSSVSKLVGKATDKNMHVFKFENSSFRKNKLYHEMPRMPRRECDCQSTHKLYNPDMRNLREVTEVTIRILFTKGGGLGAIRWVEIWGQPSVSVPKDLANKILVIHTQICSPVKEPVITTLKHTRNATPKQDANQDSNNLVIPAEFLDPLTQDLMTMPVLLPSGQTVDQSTLDKYMKEEAKWGRTPNDPFTGIPYSSNSKFLPNSSLKCRIDQFLLKHGDELKMQRLGKDTSCGQGRDDALPNSVSRLVSSQTSSPQCRNSPNTANSTNTTAGNHDSCGLKRKIVTSQSTSTESTPSYSIEDHRTYSNKRIKLEAPELQSKSGKVCARNTQESSTLSKWNDSRSPPTTSSQKTLSHSHILDQSLDSALKTALGNLPTFTKATASVPSELSPSTKCSLCGLSIAMDQYIMSCKHLLCRKCALSVRKSEVLAPCRICKTPIDKSQITRSHAH